MRVLVVLFLLLVATPAVAETINVDRVSLGVGEIGSVNVIIDYLKSGLSGYNITVWLSNPEIAEIIAVEFPGWATLKDNSTLPADFVWIKAADLQGKVNPGDSNVALAILKIKGKSLGKTGINVNVIKMDDDDSNPIEVTTISGEIEVVVMRVMPFPGCTNPPADLDNDGLYEDINGNGRRDFTDVAIFFKYLEWIEDNQPTIKPFDFNKNGRIDFDDVARLFKMI